MLGLVRAMWRATPGTEPLKRQRLHRIGESLKIAIDLAIDCAPGTMGQRAAWQRAEEAVRELGALVELTDRAAPIISAAAAAAMRSRRA
jgi:hypothetical protein